MLAQSLTHEGAQQMLIKLVIRATVLSKVTGLVSVRDGTLTGSLVLNPLVLSL
jgi:N-acyl-D-aspartate/D-glutamate deacylase